MLVSFEHKRPIKSNNENLFIKVVIAVFVCLSIGGCTKLVDRYFKAKLDGSQGSVSLPGLKAPVSVRRDTYGIPFVEANDIEDLATAIGYVHATDRLTQMIGMKLVSQGRISEMAGPATLNLDIYLRTLNLREAAENMYRNMSPEMLHLLNRYGDGVNAYINAHKDNLPPGLALAGYAPEPWQPIDSATIFTLVTLSLSLNLHEEIAALNIAEIIGPDKTAWLLPIYPDEPLPFDEMDKLRGIDLKKAAKSFSELSGRWPLLKTVGLSGQAASNNWAISKEKTQEQASIFGNDMHLFHTMPSMWNMMHVRSGQFDVAGMSIAGIPSIVAGYNGHIAWGMTMVMADNQDIFLEQLRLMDGKLYYLYKGQWLTANERKEIFKVKGKDPVTVIVHETIHGPLMNDTLSKEPMHAIQAGPIDLAYGLALGWPLATKDDVSMEAFFSLSSAGSVDEAIPLFRQIRSIPLNFVLADKQTIAWQVTGNYPIRSKGRGLVPSPGWTGEYDWKGLLDPAVLPHAKNPPAGFVATANHRTVPKDYPYVLSSSWFWPERIERITQLISAMDKHTAKTSADMQLDTFSLFVPKLKAAILTGTEASEIEKEIGSWKDDSRREKARSALKILQDFDGDMKTDSKGAALVSVFYNCAMKNIFLDELGPEDSKTWKAFLVINTNSYNAVCDHLLVRGDESPFWDDIRTPEKETKAQIIARSLADAVAALESTLGKDPQTWQWGALHHYVWETDTFKMASFLGWLERLGLKALWSYFNRGPYPAPGDLFTLNVSGYTMGSDYDIWLIPSMRMIVDFGREEPMQAMNSSGQSDNPSSPHYDDGIKAWRDGSYIPFPFEPDTVKAHYQDVLILEPPSK
jgi:acyl-homoserine-lactone acylase